ncbi:RNA polymerase sigma factor [Actinomycetospora lemnae]|uniref:Sigma-70 family RNA polymerase sigma factor n=1 Tax=Actinomycetospora lemnae TaxID=3019891 RepID=A0ABT5SYC0_9PSEU|nr:sigma-70 family RNA polymerase sigma factor [Actinomycetospora sp. DW7H6]MDD7967744.1 sigma-70 family RNA polymerase sigma factor [Actinomycetospora sp. DW7H6]
MTTQPSQDPRTDSRTDADLLAAYVSGDGDALGVLVHRYQRVLLSLVRNLAWFEPDPEAVVQEVWLRVLQSAATFSGQAKVSTWLHRITVNEAITAARRRRTRPVTPVGEVFGSFDLADRNDPADPAQPVVDREHAAALLPDLLAQLPRDQRLVLEVLHLDGLTNEEAAQLLGVAVGTIKSRAHRARVTIVAHLATRARADAGADL